VRTLVEGISVTSRSTQGVKLINLSKKERLIGIERIVSLDEEGDEEVEGDSVDDESTHNLSEETIESDSTE
jgi:DNA gyrase subunit A